MKIALVGNPNCGKTTLFNLLTGSNQYVGNWPGVTVEKKVGKLKSNKSVEIVDLPGIYSLSPYTLEEVVSRNYLLEEQPDLILNIVDVTNFERNMYLTTQLIETGIPVLIALNMMDLLKSNGGTIQIEKLKKELHCDVVEISALKNQGIRELVNHMLDMKDYSPVSIYQDSILTNLNEIESLISEQVDPKQKTWFSVKLLENDCETMKQIHLDEPVKKEIDHIREQVEDKYDDDAESIVTNLRYEFISKVRNKCFKAGKKTNQTISDKIDSIVTNRFLAIPIFVLIMSIVYYLAMHSIGKTGTDWMNDTLFGDIISSGVENFLEGIHVMPWLISLIVDGIIAGVGGVLGFLPQMIVLFLLLAILEDCGYMARVAFIMDRIFRKFGLSGKSFIPMLISTGCGVPGIMASRTIEEEKNRKMTIMLTTFIPCSAKLPIFALFTGAIFHGSAFVATSMYFIGLITVIVSGILLKKTKYFGGEPAPFVMELPPYHIPSAKGVFIHTLDRAKSFVKKAGTIILLSAILVWFTSNYNFRLESVDINDSMLASIGTFIAPIFKPLGWGEWKAVMASLTGLIAKENIVSTFGELYGIKDAVDNMSSVWQPIAASFTPVTAYSFMVFNLLCAPCFAAVGAVKREMGSAKWTWITIGFQCLVAYIVSLLINVIGSMIF